MSPVLPTILLLSGAGLGLAMLAAAEGAPAATEPSYFDPVLSGGLCAPNTTDRRLLLGQYRKLAQATETRPFPPAGSGAGTAGATDVPLYDNLGTVGFAITTKSPMAQRYFDQGLRLAYGFNHAEAVEPAMAAVLKAQQNAWSSSPREQALIEAIAQRYSSDPKAERAALDAAFAAAMGAAAARFPEDDNIQVLSAEALMDLSPWDYWEAGGAKPKGKTAEILATLETVLARSPDHPGAIHYYIHMVEASSAPERALPHAKRLAAAMPGAGHLVHMPFHIYFRVGDYKGALAANKAAVAVDEAYIAQAQPAGIYPSAYYPHNVHSLMASAQMAGDGAAAVAAAEKLARVVRADAGRTIPWVQPIMAAPFFAHAQFSAPATVLALADPGDGLPFVKAMWHYARGVAHAAQKNVAAARAEAAAIGKLKASDFSAVVEGGIPAPEMLDLARQVVLARAALAEGKLRAARAEFEAAAAIQDKLAYSEPPYWYYPVRQSLAAVLLRMGQLKEAEEAFRATLARAPHNGRALYGLGEVYRRMGRKDAAAEVMRRLDDAWAGERRTLDLARL